jgi:hypothetical protein
LAAGDDERIEITPLEPASARRGRVRRHDPQQLSNFMKISMLELGADQQVTRAVAGDPLNEYAI